MASEAASEAARGDHDDHHHHHHKQTRRYGGCGCCGWGARVGAAGGAGGGAAGACDDTWRVCLAEGVGAALLVLLSCLPGCVTPPVEPMHGAIASGFVVAMLVQCLDHISGAMMNPTVTLAAVLWGRVGRARGAAMVLSQLAGATVGGAALQAVRPAGARALCVTAPAAGLSPGRAAALEAVLGACLALANCAAWDVRNTGLRDSWPLRIGTSVAGMSLAAGLLTGASINPVRSFAPALWSGVWDHHWVYWVGPLGGSALSTVLYMCAWRPVHTHAHTHAPPDSHPDTRAIVIKTQRDR